VPAPTDKIDAFIARWQAAGGSERANYQLFVQELCLLLDVPTPDPAREDTRDNAYVFERRVTFRHGDGTESSGFIDCYRRGNFVLEAKKIRKAEGSGFDDALMRARGQAEQYARALPATEGRPPFLLVVDVGNVIELYAEFTRSGATYTPFPDPRSHRIHLTDLRDEALRNRLRTVWIDPLALDPSRVSAKVTRDVAARLARVAQVLEGTCHAPESVAQFLSRCLFSMFAEDVGLLPKRAFTNLLEGLKDSPQQFVPLVRELWTAMDRGDFSTAIRTDVLRFNGKLFKDPVVLSLDRDQIDLLLEAARADWQHVEPAIFGTLLERALDPEERHALGAHYTPRAYVERLVLPTVVEPLRDDWQLAQGAALVLAREGKLDDARKQLREFHHRLCTVRVLDPACGSGNFLYVTLEHLKRLEGEVLNQLDELGDTQGRMELAGVTVDPHQLLGIEINPRAAAIAEMVLWIGYLQWHFRTRGQVMPPQPVLKDFHNIECRDAVLAYDKVEFVMDERGLPVTRWDGKTMKKHPVTGENVPDERAQKPMERYVNPRKAEWPKADFVVGNPPFIGTKRMRSLLGDGYVDALRGTLKQIPESADYVMYWWDHAATLVGATALRRFGLITTNSLSQSFNRRVIESHLTGKTPLSLVFAVPDHPWVDAADGAAVRISMTVAERGSHEGVRYEVRAESTGDSGEVSVELAKRVGSLHADLRIGANIAASVGLVANSGISGMGVALHGAGFILDPEAAADLRLTGPEVIRSYLGGRDLLDRPRVRYLVDFSGLSETEARSRNPAAFQRIVDRVKPERDQNRRDSIRELWWRFGWERPLVRKAIEELPRYIGTTETAKHRAFQFVPADVLCDHMVICIAMADGLILGTLSSQIHVTWALAAGGTLEDRPRYNKTRCFETFPFPAATDAQQSRVRTLAEQLDVHRKRQQAAHADLTLTGMYNVLEKLRSSEPLTAKEKVIHEDGLVSVLKTLHDDLDLAVLDAYGWSDLAPLVQVVNGNTAAGKNGLPTTRDECKRALDDALLERLVALNAERAAEEKRGLVRWLRPEFQNPAGARAPTQVEMETGEEPIAVAVPKSKQPWPSAVPEQVKAVADALAGARIPMTADAIAAHFSGRGPWKRRIPELAETLVALGRARRVADAVWATA